MKFDLELIASFLMLIGAFVLMGMDWDIERYAAHEQQKHSQIATTN